MTLKFHSMLAIGPAEVAHGWPSPSGVPATRPHAPGVYKPHHPNAPKPRGSADHDHSHHTRRHASPRPGGAPLGTPNGPGVHKPHHPAAPKPHGSDGHGHHHPHR
jgi:hypothetical protein